MLYQNIRQAVSCYRNHSISCDCSILCNGNIAGSRTDIHQCHIQHTKFFRNCHLNSCNRLQCQICHMQISQFHCFIQAVYHIIRKECCDQIYCDGLCLMPFQISHLITIHIISHGRISHAIKFHIIIRIVLLEFFICLFYSHSTQRINILLCYFMVIFKVLLHISGNCTKHTACCRNTDILKFSVKILFQQSFYLGYGLSYFTDIMNLTVQHSSGLMFFGSLSQYMEFSTIQISYCTHYTSGSDIQAKYQLSLFFLYSLHEYASSFCLICL